MDTCGSPPGYATNEIFKYLLTEHKLFYCPIKANRKIDDTQAQQPYKQVQEAYWSATDVKEGKSIKLYKMPLATYFKLFPVLVTPTRTDYIITNDITQCDSETAEPESSIRWTIEQFHREAKQLTRIQNCQCRIARSQRNHIAMASLVWINLKRLAYSTQKTVYQLKQSLLDDYICAHLINPSIAFA